eukprot:Plantae.Rhodophyta-Purpureofilum_apyrenoidigerum.ctg16116.p1 GENE.Plantae.Rhodophyta-Purpureofilum_apyrenoidigerum.ctg16116~~Plantae.Rhodophyta-Purpureofilum_apyrenoidigerum.ctg16116.p1  ORF type:complete len:195 (+),score=22.15 Plantae.Rhodophyta-Purpureofilum_apyrenoidigerum.ctg16116:865-1449(+)
MAFGLNLKIGALRRPTCAGNSSGSRCPLQRSVSTCLVEGELPYKEAPLQSWHRYDAVVQPGDTDYSGYMWHGNYLRLLEAARVELMLACGLNYGKLVREYGLETPVVDMKLQYKRPAKLRDAVYVLTKGERKGIRMKIKGQIFRAEDMELLVESEVTLVFVNMKNGLPARRVPPEVEEVCRRLNRYDRERMNEE